MKTNLSIYIHIPFCVKKCLYCDFLSAPCNGAERASYVEALIDEIRYSLCPDEDLMDKYVVSTVFFGGGTPSLLSVEQLNSIMEALKERFDIAKDAEITLECNPGTVDEEKLTAIYKAGINRLSIGLQSANDEELKRLGRIHNFNDFMSTYKNARKVGFNNINIDIMSAIPGQDLDSYKATLDKVVELRPEHISSYSLIIEEGTPYYLRFGDDVYEGIEQEDDTCVKELPDLPDEDTEREMYYETNKVLKAAGYNRYEISNYSVEGKESIHNSGYWQGTEYLGFGIGASTYFKNVRYTNTDDFVDYINKCHKLSQDENPVYDDEDYDWSYDYISQLKKEGYHQAIQLLSENEKIEEYMYLGLRMMKGISIKGFYVNFKRDIFDVYGETLNKLVKEKLIQIDEDSIRLTEYGIDISNRVLANFLL